MFCIPSLTQCLFAKNEEILNTLLEKAKNLCGHLNNYISMLVKFMEKFWAPYIINSIKGTFGKRRSSHSESNHVIV